MVTCKHSWHGLLGGDRLTILIFLVTNQVATQGPVVPDQSCTLKNFLEF